MHADETGWRLNGQGCWLWCFANSPNCDYTLEHCRGRPVLQKFLTEAFDGVLITDFSATYDSVDAAHRKKCITHLLRELENVDLRNKSTEWQAFAKKSGRSLQDGMHLRKRPDFTLDRYQSPIEQLKRRIGELPHEDHEDASAQRLSKRPRRYAEHIFTLVDYPDVPADNNFGDRQTRPAVILRKNTHSNRSDRRPATQPVLMSVYRSLRLPGLNPTKTTADALTTYLSTGTLPPLPDSTVADGCSLINSLTRAAATDQGMKNGFSDNVTNKVSPRVLYSPTKPFP